MDTQADSDGAATAGTNETAPSFTPGPWESGYAGGVTGPTAVWGNSKNLHPIAKRGGAGIQGASVVALAQMKDPNWEANARLIAAAPELYAALRAILGCDEKDDAGIEYYGFDADSDVAVKARAALAKANGQ